MSNIKDQIDWQNTLSKQIDRLGMLPETRMINTVIEDLRSLYNSLSEKEYAEKAAQKWLKKYYDDIKKHIKGEGEFDIWDEAFTETPVRINPMAENFLRNRFDIYRKPTTK